MSPVSPVFHTVVTVNLPLENETLSMRLYLFMWEPQDLRLIRLTAREPSIYFSSVG